MRPLPEVVDQTNEEARRHINDDRARLAKVDIREGIDRRVVRRQPEAAGIGKLVRDQHIVEVGAETLNRREPNRFERDRRIAPQVGLHGSLIVDLVEDFARRLFRRKAPLECQSADSRVHAIGRRDAGNFRSHALFLSGLAHLVNSRVLTQFPVALGVGSP